MPLTEDCIRVPLGLAIHKQATELACLQTSTRMGIDIYLDTLAVYAVSSYIKWLGVKEDDKHRQPSTISTNNARNVNIPGVGLIQCIPVKPKETVALNRVSRKYTGLVAVSLSEDLQWAELIGCLPNSSEESISLQRFESMENLLDWVATEITDN